jgi:hypothetical protein
MTDNQASAPVSPAEVLKRARACAAAHDYENALTDYEYFFDHAMDGESRSLYGVRHSYCLDEWSKLGERFPKARLRLQMKAQEALTSFEQSRLGEKFHDFVSISRYLGDEKLAIDQFLLYHARDRQLAAGAVHFVWERLVAAKLWQVCAEYLREPNARYARALTKFDVSMAACRDDPSLGGGNFAQQISGWYIRDVSNLLLVLEHTGQADAATHLRDLMSADMGARGRPELVGRVNALVHGSANATRASP